MKWFLAMALALDLGLAMGSAVGCGSDNGDVDDDESGGARLTAPTGLKATTVDGKPHLTWTDGMNEDHYVVERMDHSVSADWVGVKDADELVPNSNQFHDGSAEASKTYMYRVVAVNGETRATSNEVSWP